jgi:hypothetical protein
VIDASRPLLVSLMVCYSIMTICISKHSLSMVGKGKSSTRMTTFEMDAVSHEYVTTLAETRAWRILIIGRFVFVCDLVILTSDPRRTVAPGKYPSPSFASHHNSALDTAYHLVYTFRSSWIYRGNHEKPSRPSCFIRCFGSSPSSRFWSGWKWTRNETATISPVLVVVDDD